MSQQTVTINGTVYDRETGLPLRIERSSATAQKEQPAQAVHETMQHTQTLSRRYVHPPQARQRQSINTQHVAVRTISKNPHISHFNNTVNTPQQAHAQHRQDIGPVPHPVVQRATAKNLEKHATTHSTSLTPKPSQVIKNEAIDEALRKASPNHHKVKAQKSQKKGARFGQFLSIASASLALLVFGGYLTYLNMPSLSTRVAAAQAGIDATYPSYQPSGYSLSGAVAYQRQSVSMKFAANAGPQSYTLTQTRSDWDSTAVRDNYVIPNLGDNYVTTSANGLTLYTSGSNAAWVNGGILYTIKGDASLSSDQLQRIATSL